jgi:hypothetical protein
MIAASPSTSVTSEFAPPPKVGAQNGALRIDHEHVGLALVRAQLIDLVLELGSVGGKEMIRQCKPLPARIVAIEAALEVAGDRREAAVTRRAHADRVELQRGGHPVVVHELPQLRQVLYER